MSELCLGLHYANVWVEANSDLTSVLESEQRWFWDKSTRTNLAVFCGAGRLLFWDFFWGAVLDSWRLLKICLASESLNLSISQSVFWESPCMLPTPACWGWCYLQAWHMRCPRRRVQGHLVSTWWTKPGTMDPRITWRPIPGCSEYRLDAHRMRLCFTILGTMSLHISPRTFLRLP